MNDRTGFFISMVKSAVELLATDKKFKNGFLAGMILAKKLATDKKNNTTKGGKSIRDGFSFKKALAIAAGPLGWVWLARHKNDEELKKVQKKLEKYEPPKTKKKNKKIEDLPVDEDEDEDDEQEEEDFPMENDGEYDDLDLDDFE